MYYRRLIITLSFGLILISCKKDRGPYATPPPGASPEPAVKHILLKDIIIPHVPSPYYHFEYNADSLPVKVDFSSGFSIYDIFYTQNKISELRDNIIVNHDTLRYSYDQTGKLVLIHFINQSNVVYRNVSFAYHGDQIKEIEWDLKQGNIGYIIDRTLSFTFYPNGNLDTIVDHRPAINGQPEITLMSVFEQYDEKINVDDFSLVHDGMHDHLFLFQGFRLQKNNPAKETFSVNGVNLYTVNLRYAYNADNTPSTRTGTLIYVSGPDSAKIFPLSTTYTYY